MYENTQRLKLEGNVLHAIQTETVIWHGELERLGQVDHIQVEVFWVVAPCSVVILLYQRVVGL